MKDNKEESIILRGSTALVATQNNYLLLKNEIGIETDTYKIKLGDGKTRWNLLPYLPFSTITKSLIDLWNNNANIPETDPIFIASPAAGITSIMINNWNNAITTETDPIFAASPASTITLLDINNWNNLSGGVSEDDIIAYSIAL